MAAIAMDSDKLWRVAPMKQIRIWLVLAVLISAASPNAIRAQPAQPPGPQVVDLKSADGTPLKATYFAAAKPGPGVLLLHQNTRTRKSWEGVALQLAAAGIHTLALDLRGFGESGTPLAKLTDDERSKVQRRWPDDVDAALQHLSIQPGVDHSMIGAGGAGWLGVLYSVDAARRHPDLIKSLVLMSGE